MSGICGIISFAGRPEGSRVASMAAAAAYRGPVHIEASVDSRAVMGRHAPNNEASQRPVTDPFLTAADLRLDNRTKIASLLRITGKNDMDLLAAGYRDRGISFLRLLVGDFALALWDHSAGSVLLARDAMGMRPLYYRIDTDGVLFASEIGQLVAGGARRKISEPAVASYLAGLPGEPDQTFYQGIHQVPPGSYVSISAARRETERFYLLDVPRPASDREEYYVEEFRRQLLQAVADRLAVPGIHGSFLSGGLDSGSAAAAVGFLRHEAHEAGDFHTYSFSSEAFPELDERGVSDHICGEYGLQQHPVFLDDAYTLSGYPNTARPDHDEPFIGHYQAMYEKVLGVASGHHVAHLWSANRGDLVVGGSVYGRLSPAALFRIYRNEGAGDGIRALRNHVIAPLLFRWAPRLRQLKRRRRVRHKAAPAWVQERLSSQIDWSQTEQDVAAADGYMADLAHQQRLELIFDPWQMRAATWSNRTHARAGMGFIDPWSDIRLVELVLTTPPPMVNTPVEPKRIARLAMAGIMPDAARLGAVKTNMKPFFDHALRGPAAPAAVDLLTNSQMHGAGFVHGPTIRKALDRLLEGGPVDSEALWAALTLEMWLRDHWS